MTDENKDKWNDFTKEELDEIYRALRVKDAKSMCEDYDVQERLCRELQKISDDES